MSLPHVTMITTYDGEQDICLYGGSYIDIIQSFGMKSGLTPGTSTVYSNLYGQGNCCNGGSCCNCDDCGGQLYANVEVESSGANGEIGLMLTHLGQGGFKYTGTKSCHWGVNSCWNGVGLQGCGGTPNPGRYTSKHGRVDLIYGPFTDYTGRYPNQHQGVNPSIAYSIMETPIGICSAGTVAGGGVMIGAELFGLIFEEEASAAGGVAGVIGAAIGTGLQCLLG